MIHDGQQHSHSLRNETTKIIERKNIMDMENQEVIVDNESKKIKEVTIIVNGRDKVVEKKEITYEEIIVLAFGSYETDPNIEYTVTYSKGNNSHKPKGILEKGESIMVKEGMIFNVTRTDKS